MTPALVAVGVVATVTLFGAPGWGAKERLPRIVRAYLAFGLAMVGVALSFVQFRLVMRRHRRQLRAASGDQYGHRRSGPPRGG